MDQLIVYCPTSVKRVVIYNVFVSKLYI
jgi:hypothetical protein